MVEAPENGKESSHSACAVGINKRTLVLPCQCHSTNYLYLSGNLSLTPGAWIWEDTIQCRFFRAGMLICITVSQLRKRCIPISVVCKGFNPAASNSNHNWAKYLPIKNKAEPHVTLSNKCIQHFVQNCLSEYFIHFVTRRLRWSSG